MKISNDSLSQMIMPIGGLKWMFHKKKPFRVNGVSSHPSQGSVSGLYEKAIKIETTEDLDMIMVFFQPYAAKMVMNMPGQNLANGNFDLDSLESLPFKELRIKVLEAETDKKCIEIIESFILEQLIKTQDSPYLKPLMEVFSLMDGNQNLRVENLAEAACLSERQFRRVFTENVGMSPKQILRILRFRQAANAIMHSDGNNLDDLLYKFNYTDHSHLNREFHDIAGLSPTEYLQYLAEVKKQGVMPTYCSYHDPKA